jgi:plastocyanin
METAAQIKSMSFNWRTLLHLAVAGNLAILIYMVVTGGDVLALALAAAFLLGLGLLHFRSGVLGILITGLLSMDIAIWTVSGAVSNFLNGEKLSALILPAYLGVVSLTAVVAAAATWLTRKDPARGELPAQRLGQITLALLFVITVSGLLVRQRPVEAVQPTDIQLTTENMKFSQNELFSESGQVSLHLANEDLWWHTFTIDELGVDLKVPMGAEREVEFSAPPGTYRYYCSIPGHEASMHGTLTIK